MGLVVGAFEDMDAAITAAEALMADRPVREVLIDTVGRGALVHVAADDVHLERLRAVIEDAAGTVVVTHETTSVRRQARQGVSGRSDRERSVPAA